jgi:guanylate kinase
MNDGVIITGTRGAGKTTLSRLLVASNTSFVLVPAVTTRSERTDDAPGAYDYLESSAFETIDESGGLLISATYGSYRYGILKSAASAVVSAGRIPVITVTPQAAHMLLERPEPISWTGIFLDAPDEMLDERLARDGRPASQFDVEQRHVDRSYAGPPLVVLLNASTFAVATQLLMEHIPQNWLLRSDG